jgi:hypothetical protein
MALPPIPLIHRHRPNACNDIDIPLFLDYILYSDHLAVKTSNLSNAVLVARTALLYSDELPGILRRWHSRPTQHGRGMSSESLLNEDSRR